jgi:hypothetical protein
MEQWRPLTAEERSVIARILEKEFRGRDALRAQLDHTRARPIDDTGSIELDVAGGERSEMSGLVPVYARFPDADGFEIEIQLFVQDGKLKELQVSKEDGSTVIHFPTGPLLRID